MIKIFLLALALSVPTTSSDVQKHLDNINDQMDVLHKNILLRNQMDDEFVAMTLELRGLNDPKVDSVMQPHIDKILDLAKRIK